MNHRQFLAAIQALLLMATVGSVLPTPQGAQVQKRLATDMAAAEHLTQEMQSMAWEEFIRDPKNTKGIPVVNFRTGPNTNVNMSLPHTLMENGKKLMRKKRDGNTNNTNSLYFSVNGNNNTNTNKASSMSKNEQKTEQARQVYNKMSTRAKALWTAIIGLVSAAGAGITMKMNPLEERPSTNNKSNNKSNNNNRNRNRHVLEILTLAQESLAKTGFRLPDMARFNNTTAMEYVDDVLTDMVRAFNGVSKKHQVSLYNGITGELITGPQPIANQQYKEHIYIRLGHMLVPLDQATLPKQFGLRSMASAPRVLMNKVRKNVRVEGDVSSIGEVARFDATIRKVVRETNSPITVIAYSIGRQLQYSMKDPRKQVVQEKRYLYQGIIPSKFRRSGQTFCYVLSKFPPTITQDKVILQKESGARPNPNEPIQKRVLKTVFSKHHWRTPRFVKQASAEDVGVVAAAVGLSTLGISSLAMVL